LALEFIQFALQLLARRMIAGAATENTRRSGSRSIQKFISRSEPSAIRVVKTPLKISGNSVIFRL